MSLWRLHPSMESCSRPSGWLTVSVYGRLLRQLSFFLRFLLTVLLVGKKHIQAFFLRLPIKTCVRRLFLQMRWFSILLLLLIFVLPSESLKTGPWTFKLSSKHTLPPFFFLPFPLYIFLDFLPQNSVSLSQNNNNKLSDAARWPAHTPEGTESHSSTATDNPLCKAGLPLLEQCSHLHQSDPQIDAGKGWREGMMESKTYRQIVASSVLGNISQENSPPPPKKKSLTFWSLLAFSTVLKTNRGRPTF